MSTTLSSSALFEQLRIHMSRPSPAVVRVAVVGEADLATADQLYDELLCALSAGAVELLEVNLAGVTFLDCAGLGVLVAVRATAARTGCRLRVTNPRPIVRRVLDVTGLFGLTFDQVPPALAVVIRPPGVLVAAG